jgi:hypothetical protein
VAGGAGGWRKAWKEKGGSAQCRENQPSREGAMHVGG